MRLSRLWIGWCVTLAACTAPQVGRPDLHLQDTAGRTHDLGGGRAGAIRVLVVMDTQCPISNSYVPTLNRLHQRFTAAPQPVEWYGVISNPAVSRQEAAAHSAEYRVGFPVLLDESGELAARLAPTHTPEAFVLDATDQVRYRGRIDNLYAALGRRRPQATEHNLSDAITALLAHQPVPHPRTRPVGCVFER